MKFGSVDTVDVVRPPMPDSSIPPCHTGTPCAAHTSWTAIDSANPPIRPGLMLTMRHAPAAMASRATRGESIELIETDGRLQPALELRVVANIVVIERLLDHHQVERVERCQVADVWHRVRRVGVHHQGNRAEASRTIRTASMSQPGLILIFHPPIAGVQFLFG